jgi:flagellar hook-length control protein FliK
MTAHAVAPPLPADPSPAPPPAPQSGGENHFLAVFGAKASTTTQSATTAAPKDATAPQPAALRKLPSTSERRDGADQPATAAPGNGTDAATGAIPLPLPLLAQLQQPPIAIAPTAIDATTTAVPPPPVAVTNSLPLPTALAAPATAKATPLAPPATGALTPSLPLATTGALAAEKTAPATLVSASTALARNSAPSLASAAAPAANASAPASAAAPASASSDARSGNAAPLASTINARLASGAAVLVSQPRVALASLAPAGDKAAAKATTSDGGLPTNVRQLAAQSTHEAEEAPVTPAAARTSEQPLTPAKDNLTSAVAASAAHEPGTRESTVPALDNGALNTPSPPPAVPVAQSAPPPNEAPATLPIIPHAVAEQVAINVHQAVKSGTDHIQIQLQPADLGTIDVKLNVNHDGRVTVVVSADRSDTLNLLQQDAGSLTQALRDAGLQADNSSLSFNLRGGFQFQQQQSAGSSGGSRDGAYPSDGDGGDVIAAPLPTLRRHAGALDIHV